MIGGLGAVASGHSASGHGKNFFLKNLKTNKQSGARGENWAPSLTLFELYWDQSWTERASILKSKVNINFDIKVNIY